MQMAHYKLTIIIIIIIIIIINRISKAALAWHESRIESNIKCNSKRM